MKNRILILTTLAASLIVASTLQAQTPVVERLRETYLRLDANSDQVLERSEIPEAGLAAFDRLVKRGDSNSDGKLDVEEMQGLGKKVRALTGDTANVRQARMAAMDADGDGSISREEFRGQAALFDRLDIDKDGKISPKELPTPAAQPAGQQLGAGRLKAMDANDDGKLSREEFRGQPALFDRLDIDKDGLIDGSEQKAAAQRAAALRGKPAKAKKSSTTSQPSSGEHAPPKTKDANDKR